MYNDVINLSFSIHCRCSSVIATATLLNEGAWENVTWGGGGADGGEYIATRRDVCPRALLIVTANATVTGNSILHSMKGMAGRMWWNKPKPRYKDSCATLWLWKPLTVMCCHSRRPKEANIFHVIHEASGKSRAIKFWRSFLSKTVFWKGINENKGDRHQCQNHQLSKSFYRENPVLNSVHHGIAK
jgi:hypothetical protein